MLEVGLNKWKIIPLLTLKSDKATILQCEMEFCDELKADLNEYKAYLPEEERLKNKYKHYQDLKEEVREKSKAYYQKHKEKLNKKLECKVCGRSFSVKNEKQHFWTKKAATTKLSFIG